MNTKKKSNIPRNKSARAYKFVGSTTRKKPGVATITGKVLSTARKAYVGQKTLSPTQNKLSYVEDNLTYSAADQVLWQKSIKELSFGRTIRAYRLAEEWSLADAAEKIGISVQQLSDYEHGRKFPSLEKAYEIAKALGMMPQGLVIQVINEQLCRAALPMKVQLAS